MNPNGLLNEIRIASPCEMPWGGMKGDDRVRFCESCGKHVYNFAAIPGAESVELIRKAEGRLCIRLYRRRDGTVITGDCPVGLKAAASRRLRRLVHAAAVLTGAWALGDHLNEVVTRLGSGSSLASVVRGLQDWIQRLGPTEQRGEMAVAGMLEPLPPATTPGVTPAPAPTRGVSDGS